MAIDLSCQLSIYVLVDMDNISRLRSAVHMGKSFSILGIGELLWDLLEDRGQLDGVPIRGSNRIGYLGGAPANFAVMSARLGNHARLMSRLGDDELGRLARYQLEDFPVDTDNLQTDSKAATGTVDVQLVNGQPSYTINEPAAWDFLEASDRWLELASEADALCFGSLGQRHPQARRTISALARAAKSNSVRVFDVNLRPPFISAEVIGSSLPLASVLKMNDAEVPQICKLLGIDLADNKLSTAGGLLLGRYPALELVAITCGGEGSVLISREGLHRHAGIRVPVVDTIGAGDAFTAGLVTALLATSGPLSAQRLAQLNEVGNRCGSWVASRSGAMPEWSVTALEHLLSAL